MSDTKKQEARRVRESGGRPATELENEVLRVLVSDQGGVISELSAKRAEGWMNAHWIPEFRANSGELFDASRHGQFWKVNLLYNIAGNFPCAPNFGGGHRDGAIDHPPHGWTANESWNFQRGGHDDASGALWALSTMKSPDTAMPLSFTKIDALLPGQGIHYASLRIANHGSKDEEIVVGWHNTVGAPFLHQGARISVSARRFATPPLGGEFDDTGRLAIGAEFESLEKAPLRGGGTCDLTRVPGMIGYTDFVTGPVPEDLPLGWTAVCDPASSMVYACFFPGPQAAGDDGIALRFNDLWLQYGGRPFTPWAPYEGGADRSFCLGTENALGAYANGLGYSKEQKSLMGAPTTTLIPAGSSRTLRYGTLFSAYEEGVLDEGLATLEPEVGALVLTGRGSIGAGKKNRFPADADFSTIKALESKLS